MGKTTVIKNGFVVDGTGIPSYLADVLIETTHYDADVQACARVIGFDGFKRNRLTHR